MRQFRRRLAELSPLRVLRLTVLVLLVVTLLSVGYSFLTYDPITPTATAAPTGGDPSLVVTIDGVGPGQLIALDADGEVVYHDDTLGLYHDVDPSPMGQHTVTYVASDPADSNTCPGESCLRNVIERANLTTGEVTSVHSWVDTRNGSTQTHSIDQVNESVFLVADISFPDRVYMVDTRTGEEIWEWRVSEAYEPESGGAYPRDWTHINEVELLPDGRVMANLRNQDQVIFIDPEEGIQPNWTLGADGDHEILYEPHNPDYIPESRGGPAVVVADSENNRLVEYQRVNGSWERTWHWQDATMQWPRDADRLPSGQTLVADSHGQRVLSVSPRGQIAWSVPLPPGSYDVECLGTGPESAGGYSAQALDLRSRWPGVSISDGSASTEDAINGTCRPGNLSADVDPDRAVSDGTGLAGQQEGIFSHTSTVGYWVVSVVPPLVLHGTLYVLPPWVAADVAVLLLITSTVSGGWLVAELGVRIIAASNNRRFTD